MNESPNNQGVALDRALKCEMCGRKAIRTYYCRRHDVVLCGMCMCERHSDCAAWRVLEEEVAVDADEERLKSHRRTSERMRAFASEQEGVEAKRRLARRIVVLALAAGLVALMLVLTFGCSSSVPQIVRDRAPAARRAAEIYVERTEPRAELSEEERAETRELGEALLRYLREMEAATR